LDDSSFFEVPSLEICQLVCEMVGQFSEMESDFVELEFVTLLGSSYSCFSHDDVVVEKVLFYLLKKVF
jgi:hypothetical protein